MRLVKRSIVMGLLLASVFVSPAKPSVQAQAEPIFYRITEFPAGNLCNFPGGLFPWDATNNEPMITEANTTPDSFYYFYVSAPGLWRRVGQWNIYGWVGPAVTTLPDFPAYQLPANTTITLEVEVYPEHYTHTYNPYYSEVLPTGDLAYYQYLEINCSTGEVLYSDETFFD